MKQISVALLCTSLLFAGCNRAQTPATVSADYDQVIDSDFAGTVNAVPFPAGAAWLNTDHPLTLQELRGKIVLLDFWTYCCINCIHILPDLKRIEQEYPEVVVIGVHSAKFQNEQDAENIRQAILRYEIEHPVVVDNGFELWSSYSIRAWPSFALIDPRGKLVGTTSGEGVYQQLKPYLDGMKKLFSERGLLNTDRMQFNLVRSSAPSSPLAYPGKLDVDETSGRIYFSDSNHNRIIVIQADGTLEIIIGSGAPGAQDGAFDVATFFRPQGVAYDAATDALYVADTENHLIRRISFKTQTVETLAGTGQQAQTFERYANGTEDPLNSPWDVLYQQGTLYIAMAGPHQLWRLDPKTRQATVVAGSGRENIVDGPALQAALAQPSGLATDGKTIYFADSEVSALRKLENGEVKTLIGEGLFEFGDVDGTYPKARMQHVIGVTWHKGKLYAADTYNHKIKVYDPATGRLSTYLGTGTRGSQDGKGKQATFSEPNDLAWLKGKLYILDTNNGLIRVYDPETDLVSTLKLPAQPLSLMQAATRTQDVPFFGDHVALPAAELKPSADVALQLQLPEGYKLNTEAPNYAEIVGMDVRAGLTQRGQTVTTTLKLPKELPDSLVVEVGVYYCESGREAVCKIKLVRFEVPVVRATTGSAALVLPYSLPH